MNPNVPNFVFYGAVDHVMDDDDWFEEMFLNLLHIEALCDEENEVDRIPQRTSALTGAAFVHEVLHGHPGTCYELFRMKRDTFISLADVLRANYIQDTRTVSVEESLAIFCLIVGHRQGMRVAADRFQHSTETISRNFMCVMRALCNLGKSIIRPRNVDGVHPYIQENPKYYPWFQNCVGAIDGTHIKAWVPAQKQNAFRGRKGVVSQNVVCACNFDMMFTFVYTGWEGTTNDSRVFYDAITRPENEFPTAPEDHYYLVDSGFPCYMGYLPPYRGERYHLQDFRNGGDPQGFKELFNYRHSSLRMVIERCFGVLKTRFHVLNGMPKYKVCRQPLVVNACCTLHNFIRQANRNDMFFEHAPPVILGDGADYPNHYDFSDASALNMANTRDQIAQLMWDNRPGPN
ncbi:protein ALP1-like [Corylus avellana]|uniref:protein ALP1-like n=1 Tax=Corylus avellana TaxID=13451 RepID=UPI001E1EFB25|nr:protein ALP1-like [Corylus avellana]